MFGHSPAEYVRRPNVPDESPTLGLTHLQFEAILTASRLSNTNDFALGTMPGLLGLLGLRVFEACGSNITDVGEEHGHRALRVNGKGGKVVLVPLPPAVGRASDRAIGDRTRGPILLSVEAPGWTDTAPPGYSTASQKAPGYGLPGRIPTCFATRS